MELRILDKKRNPYKSVDDYKPVAFDHPPEIDVSQIVLADYKFKEEKLIFRDNLSKTDVGTITHNKWGKIESVSIAGKKVDSKYMHRVAAKLGSYCRFTCYHLGDGRTRMYFYLTETNKKRILPHE
jgi:hypothetical protein